MDEAETLCARLVVIDGGTVKAEGSPQQLIDRSFAAIGVLLGAVLPSAQSAQALGVLLWFVLLILGGAGPPPEVLTGALGTIGDMSLLRQAIEVMQYGWLGLDPGRSWLIVTGVTLVAGLLAVRLFRWE